MSARPASAGCKTDDHLLDRLRQGDERAFETLVRRHNAAMLNVALDYVPSRAVAEEVVQETWLAVVRGLGAFEGRSSLKTWIFRILINRARSRGVRESRCVASGALTDDADGSGDQALEEDRSLFGATPAPRPADAVVAVETRERIATAIDRLGSRQRAVLVMRDLEGRSSEEVCAALDLSEGNQRVLLHRARAGVRAELAPYLA